MAVQLPDAFVLHLTFAPAPGAPAPVCLPLKAGTPAQGGGVRALLQRDEAGVWQLHLQACGAPSAALRQAALHLEYPAALWDEALRYYHSGSHTNDFTAARAFSQYDGARMRDVALLHHTAAARSFGAAYVTAHRFYMDIAFAAPAVVLAADMEDKPLYPGEDYALERFILCGDAAGEETAQAFLVRCADTIARLNDARPLAEAPVGWCSWSCFYSDVNDSRIQAAAADTAACLGARGASLVQIDDGWQEGHSFPGIWREGPARFAGGLQATAQCVRAHGMDFGLWVAPLLVEADTPFWPQVAALVRTDEVTLRSRGVDIHPFNWDEPAVYRHLYDTFVELTQRYQVRYFKLDFLSASFIRFTPQGGRVYCRSDYCVALLRKALATIRRAVGDQVTLLSCGAPVLESAGIFNAARTSCDIIWGKGAGQPTHWQIMRQATQTVLHRWFYHGRVFCNDPDGLVLRDWDNGDGFNCSWAEAKYWATTVAFSGGSMLINEELSRLSAPRRELVRRMAPVLGVAGRPCDFFALPEGGARGVIDCGPDARFAAVWYDGDVMADGSFSTAEMGFEQALVVRCWDGEVLGVTDTVTERDRLPHSAEMYLLLRVPQRPCFLCAEGHVFCGFGLFAAQLAGESWQLHCDARAAGITGAVYGWVPEGWPWQGPTVKRVPGGSVVCIRPPQRP